MVYWCQATVNTETDRNAFVDSSPGLQKRIWLILRKLKDHVIMEKIRKYLEGISKYMDQIVVQEIETYWKKDCYLLSGRPFSLLNEDHERFPCL